MLGIAAAAAIMPLAALPPALADQRNNSNNNSRSSSPSSHTESRSYSSPRVFQFQPSRQSWQPVNNNRAFTPRESPPQIYRSPSLNGPAFGGQRYGNVNQGYRSPQLPEFGQGRSTGFNPPASVPQTFRLDPRAQRWVPNSPSTSYGPLGTLGTSRRDQGVLFGNTQSQRREPWLPQAGGADGSTPDWSRRLPDPGPVMRLPSRPFPGVRNPQQPVVAPDPWTPHSGFRTNPRFEGGGVNCITVIPQAPQINIDQPNYFRRHRHDDDDGTVIVDPWPVFWPPYYNYPWGYPDPQVVYVPQPDPQVIYVPSEPQVIYVPDQPPVEYSPQASNPSTDGSPNVIIQQDGVPGDQSADGSVDVPGAASGSDGSSAALPSGARAAILDIQEGWILADLSLLQNHVDPAYRIGMYKNGALDYTSTVDNYIQMTKKALGSLVTQSFVLDRRVLLADGRVRASGVHVYYDADNHRQTLYVTYWLQPVGDRWIITAIDSSPQPVQFTGPPAGE